MPGHTKDTARRQRQFVRGGNRLGAHTKSTTCVISKTIAAGFERSAGSRKVQQRTVRLVAEPCFCLLVSPHSGAILQHIRALLGFFPLPVAMILHTFNQRLLLNTEGTE